MAVDSRAIEIGIEVRARSSGSRRVGESENDILRGCSGPGDRRASGAGPSGGGRRAAAGVARTRGLWTVEIGGRRCGKSQGAYACCSASWPRPPDFLEAFAEEKTLGRRFVARSPAGLYVDAASCRPPRLADRRTAGTSIPTCRCPGRQARPDRGAPVRAALWLGRPDSRQSEGNLRPRPPPAPATSEARKSPGIASWAGVGQAGRRVGQGPSPIDVTGAVAP